MSELLSLLWSCLIIFETIVVNTTVKGYTYNGKLQFQLQSETVVKMALQGVWQLKKLIVSYCDWGVSSQKRSSPRSFCAEAEAEALLVKQWISGLTFTCGYTVFAMLSTVSAIPVTRFKPGSKKT
ncbi:hypothetical protein V6N12_047724 [Hibiscus sabdariffa]|uniref:Uncharacterized protein n=1 Tax=Hibiscus sabdariffa TaxID=183260 RepID=A0ABR2CTT4_9ROSI